MNRVEKSEKRRASTINFGEKIRNAREDKDISQMQIAKLIPMNQSNYSKIERNLQEPNLEQLRRICMILNLDPRYLLDLNDFEYLSREDAKLLNDAKKFIAAHKNI